MTEHVKFLRKARMIGRPTPTEPITDFTLTRFNYVGFEFGGKRSNLPKFVYPTLCRLMVGANLSMPF